MKKLIMLILVLPALAMASDDSTHLCVAYKSGPDASNPDHWTVSKVATGPLNQCIELATNPQRLDGLELDNGYTVKSDDSVDIWCDTSDDPARQCM